VKHIIDTSTYQTQQVSPAPSQTIQPQNNLESITNKLAELSLMVIKNNTSQKQDYRKNGNRKYYNNKKVSKNEAQNNKKDGKKNQSGSGTVSVCAVCFKPGHSAQICWHREKKDTDLGN